MLIRPSFKKSLIVEQFQGNYLKPGKELTEAMSIVKFSFWVFSVFMMTIINKKEKKEAGASVFLLVTTTLKSKLLLRE